MTLTTQMNLKHRAVGLSLVLLGLYGTSSYSFLLFHALVEIFSIVIACGMFIIVWNSRKFLGNNYLLFLGISFLFTALIDLLHTLTYKGMGVFPGNDANLATQMWIAARYLESVSLIAAPLLLKRRLRFAPVFLIFGIVSTLLILSIMTWRIFPACFVVGQGLTPFKIVSEYVICVFLTAAMALLFVHRKAFDRRVHAFLTAAIAATIVSELAFTLYISVYGLSNLVGHFSKLIAFYLFYLAIVETGFLKPFNLLLRDLQQKKSTLEEEDRQLRQVLENLQATQAELEVLATTDPLTGCCNRRQLFARGEQEFARAQRYSYPLALAMMDLDHFKQVNDTHGHAAGDWVLREVTAVFQEQIRHIDTLGRIGGEEFVVLLPHATAIEAEEVAKRLLRAVSNRHITWEGHRIPMTVSIGISVPRGQDRGIDDILARADTALYAAKQAGRNQVVLGEESSSEARPQ